MRILFYQDPPSINSTLLTWTLAEELRLIGHKVYWSTPAPDSVPKGLIDWIHTSGDKAWKAHAVARACGAKLHTHLEGVAHWRVGANPATDWGYKVDLTQEEINWWIQRYRDWMSAAFQSDSCSVNGTKQTEMIEKYLFNGNPLPNCYKISGGIDARYSGTISPYYPKKWQMVTASRLEGNKKILMMAEALSKLDTEKLPLWVIAGYGTKAQTEKLLSFCNENKIRMKLNPCFGAEKWKIINDSCLMLSGWTGLPPGEASMCKVPTLAFDHEDIVEWFGDSIHWAKDNDVMDFAEKTQSLLDNVDRNGCNWHDPITEKGREKLLNGELFACTIEQAAKQYEKIFTKEMFYG